MNKFGGFDPLYDRKFEHSFYGVDIHHLVK